MFWGAAKRGLPVQGRPPEATPRAWGEPTTMRTLAEGAGRQPETGEQAEPQRGGCRWGAKPRAGRHAQAIVCQGRASARQSEPFTGNRLTYAKEQGDGLP